ncbi:hypothetical protein P8452_70944 [Trifolium repens]|nr:hypothetical protein P8452_70944 [Trifolium repens]
MRLTLFASNLGSHIPHSIDLSFWILSWLTCKDMVGTQLFCILLWKFWYGRNQTIFKGVVIDPIALAADAICYVHEFNEANPRRCNQTLLDIIKDVSLAVFDTWVSFESLKSDTTRHNKNGS